MEVGMIATVDDVQRRLDWTLNDSERGMAESAIEDAVAICLAEVGLVEAPNPAPAVVKTVVLSAAVRWLNNPQGLTQSRAGDETLGWDGIGDKAGSVYLTDSEKALVRRAFRVDSLMSVPLALFGGVSDSAVSNVGRVPTSDGGTFPYFASDGPW